MTSDPKEKNRLTDITEEELAEFNMTKTIVRIEEYVNAHFHKGDQVPKDKVFYNYYELGGWRFYWKAIKHQDWRSLKGHILSTLRLR